MFNWFLKIRCNFTKRCEVQVCDDTFAVCLPYLSAICVWKNQVENTCANVNGKIEGEEETLVAAHGNWFH